MPMFFVSLEMSAENLADAVTTLESNLRDVDVKLTHISVGIGGEGLSEQAGPADA